MEDELQAGDEVGGSKDTERALRFLLFFQAGEEERERGEERREKEDRIGVLANYERDRRGKGYRRGERAR